MHEYRLVDQELVTAGIAELYRTIESTLCSCFVGGEKDMFVLCRIFQKNGLGPPKGNRFSRKNGKMTQPFLFLVERPKVIWHLSMRLGLKEMTSCSKMSCLSPRFGQFYDFRPEVCFSASGSKRFEILLFSSSS
ncbi:putative transcription factor NAM family [Helianthus anomalus]